MAQFGNRINKSERPDKTSYTLYYPHTILSERQKWDQPYIQLVSIDPARKNYALRIERRYFNGWIKTIVFIKVSIDSIKEENDITVNNTYQELTYFLDRYKEFYNNCHYIIIERQLPANYKATRIAQHTIAYFSIHLHNSVLLPYIVEINPKLKGKMLGAPKGLSDSQLKSWAVEKGHELFNIRKDNYSLEILKHFKNKQDDLCDTACQAEAFMILLGYLATVPPPIDNNSTSSINDHHLTLNIQSDFPIRNPNLTLNTITNNAKLNNQMSHLTLNNINPTLNNITDDIKVNNQSQNLIKLNIIPQNSMRLNIIS